jgi:hypothetical protein
VARQIQHTLNCNHFNCHVAEPHPGLSQSPSYGCCETEATDELQQEWLKPLPNLDILQPRSHIPEASTSIAMHDSEIQLQTSAHSLVVPISSARQLQGIPYPVGVATCTSMPHRQFRCSNCTALHHWVHDCASTIHNPQTGNDTSDVFLQQITSE